MPSLRSHANVLHALILPDMRTRSAGSPWGSLIAAAFLATLLGGMGIGLSNANLIVLSPGRGVGSGFSPGYGDRVAKLCVILFGLGATARGLAIARFVTRPRIQGF